MTKKKVYRKYLLMISFLCLILSGQIYAFWTGEIRRRNEFTTAEYNTCIVENFISPEKWIPGETVVKEISIKNEGTIPVFARISINQRWIRNNEKLPLAFKIENNTEWASKIGWGKDVVLLKEGKGGEPELDLPTVDSLKEAEGKWLLLTDKIDKKGNLNLYFIGTIEEKEVSPDIVSKVTMNSEIEPAVKLKKIWYSELMEKQTEEFLNSEESYENAQYFMDVEAQTVQATAKAVKMAFGEDKEAQEVVRYLAENESIKTGGKR